MFTTIKDRRARRVAPLNSGSGLVNRNLTVAGSLRLPNEEFSSASAVRGVLE